MRELPAPSVNDVLVDNPLDVAVLLYEGEEVQGAQQDRTLDVSVLVAARSRLAGAGQLRGGRPLGRPPADAKRSVPRRRAPSPSCGGRRAARRA